jgi:hypothetical protein
MLHAVVIMLAHDQLEVLAIFLQGLRKTTGFLIRVTNICPEIRTQDLQNTKQECY